MTERGELATLAAALAAHVRRAEARGLRAARAAAEAGLAPPAPQAGPAPAPAPAAAPVRPPAEPSPAAAAPRAPAPVGGDALRPNVPVARAAGSLEELSERVAACRACGLCESRTRTVFSDGNGTAGVMFVGEAPGFHEDQEGVPFVGKAGQLLTDIVVKGMGLRREDVYIANVLKCRPPENRDPTGLQKELCTPFLDRQIELVDPRVIVPLGRHAAGHLLGTDAPMGRLRGRVHRLGGRAVVPTFHPAYLLRSPSAKKDCWQDIQLAMAELGLEPPRRSGR